MILLKLIFKISRLKYQWNYRKKLEFEFSELRVSSYEFDRFDVKKELPQSFGSLKGSFKKNWEAIKNSFKLLLLCGEKKRLLHT
jgi:hypothetical protein